MIKAKLLLIADWLFSFRVVFLLLAAISAAGIVYGFVFLTPVQQNKIVMPSFLALLWSIMFYTLLLFTQKKPQDPSEKLSLIKHFKLKVHRLFYFLFTLVFIGLTLAVFIVTLRLLSVLH
ncbi:MAG: hypothetical protein MJK12_13825 [Colwellia sp.]|nr:hypothetical protein [Colwellia sp.]